MARDSIFERKLREKMQVVQDAEKRSHLDRWLADPRREELWATIDAKAKENLGVLSSDVGVLIPGYFIDEILGFRSLAMDPSVYSDYVGNAVMAEKLASFLEPVDGKPPPAPELLKQCPDAVTTLMQIARHLRERDITLKNSPLYRKTRKSCSQARMRFMFWTSDFIRNVCGEFLDDVTRVLTDIAFPGQETTSDQVRSTRRPTTISTRFPRGA